MIIKKRGLNLPIKFLKHPKNAHDRLMATNEEWYTLTENSNKQNNRYWATEPPDYEIAIT